MIRSFLDLVAGFSGGGSASFVITIVLAGFSSAGTMTIVGTDGSPDAIAAAAEHATEGVTVLEDLYGSEEYKEHLAKVYVRRALSSALDTA